MWWIYSKQFLFVFSSKLLIWLLIVSIIAAFVTCWSMKFMKFCVLHNNNTLYVQFIMIIIIIWRKWLRMNFKWEWNVVCRCKCWMLQSIPNEITFYNNTKTNVSLAVQHRNCSNKFNRNICEQKPKEKLNTLNTEIKWIEFDLICISEHI